MTLTLIKKNSFLKNLIFKLWLWDAREKAELIEKYLNKSDKILDIGSGPGSVTETLRQKNFIVTPIDIKDHSFSSDLAPQVFNGKEIPFGNNSFDVALLLTVLHHVQDQETLILEAKRVAKKVIIIEDVYDNFFQKHFTFFTDSLINWEFSDHPHNNKTDQEWRDLFSDIGFNFDNIQFRKILIFFKQTIYLLSK